MCAVSAHSLFTSERIIRLEFVDKAFARRLEAAEQMPQVHYAKLYQKLRPEIGAAVEEFCGGHMIFAGLNSFIGRTVGAGLDGSLGGAELDRMEQFYRSHGAPAQIDICPLTDLPVLEMLKQRGYTLAELNTISATIKRTGDGKPKPSTSADPCRTASRG